MHVTPSTTRQDRLRFATDLARKILDTKDNEGRRLYALSVTFNEPASLTNDGVLHAMRRVYKFLLIHIVNKHNFQSAPNRPRQPLVYAFMDLPGSKFKRRIAASKGSGGTNIGSHIHAVVAAHPTTVEKLEAFTRENSLNMRARPVTEASRKMLQQVRTSKLVRIEEQDSADLNARFESLRKWIGYACELAWGPGQTIPSALDGYQVYPEALSERSEPNWLTAKKSQRAQGEGRTRSNAPSRTGSRATAK